MALALQVDGQRGARRHRVDAVGKWESAVCAVGMAPCYCQTLTACPRCKTDAPAYETAALWCRNLPARHQMPAVTRARDCRGAPAGARTPRRAGGLQLGGVAPEHLRNLLGIVSRRGRAPGDCTALGVDPHRVAGGEIATRLRARPPPADAARPPRTALAGARIGHEHRAARVGREADPQTGAPSRGAFTGANARCPPHRPSVAGPALRGGR